MYLFYNIYIAAKVLGSDLLWEKNCSSEHENPLNFGVEGQEFANFEKNHYNNLFKQWKVRTIFGNRMLF